MKEKLVNIFDIEMEKLKEEKRIRNEEKKALAE